jgi:hypothetical protein
MHEPSVEAHQNYPEPGRASELQGATRDWDPLFSTLNFAVQITRNYSFLVENYSFGSTCR